MYPSLKPLASWVIDLIARVDQMKSWAEGRVPNVFWLGGFTFPTGFLTAVLQLSARINNVSVDAMTWEFVILKETTHDITQGKQMIIIIPFQFSFQFSLFILSFNFLSIASILYIF